MSFVCQNRKNSLIARLSLEICNSIFIYLNDLNREGKFIKKKNKLGKIAEQPGKAKKVGSSGKF